MSDPNDIRLSDLIGPAFYDVHRAVRSGAYTHFWLPGGRGSLKSSFVSVEIPLGMMADPSANAVVYRKVADTLEGSVYQQMLWAIEQLGVSHLWQSTTHPMRLIYRPTGQRIIFRGLDKPTKSKSIKVAKGYIKFVWFEELDEFSGMEEIRSVLQSTLRGGPDFRVFYSYNPPRALRNWVNAEAFNIRPDRMVCHTTYEQAPRAWLGEQFWLEAEHLKAVNPDAWRHEYLGEAVGTGAEVFCNLTNRRITDEEIAGMPTHRRGLDWGYAADPLHYTACSFDRTHRRLYVYGEIHARGMSMRDLAEQLRRINPTNKEIIADSADARSNAELRNEYGINVLPVRKGPVNHGVRWLQDLEEIVIDAERCPNTWREFSQYELERDAAGNLRGDYPDKDNHSIDAVRYALETDIKNVRVT